MMDDLFCEIIKHVDSGSSYIYNAISKIIPLSFEVIDFGCGKAQQAWYFRNHKKYIGIDNITPIGNRYLFINTEHIKQDINDFINSKINDIDIDINNTFAISIYLPALSEIYINRIKEVFTNLYIYYPAGIYSSIREESK